MPQFTTSDDLVTMQQKSKMQGAARPAAVANVESIECVAKGGEGSMVQFGNPFEV